MRLGLFDPEPLNSTPNPVITSLAGFAGSELAGFAGGRRPHTPGGRTAMPAVFR